MTWSRPGLDKLVYRLEESDLSIRINEAIKNELNSNINEYIVFR